ncbi:MAG: 1-(5-phosphoribosyl)-5-[(5-phosphoribosylamino)methylideneamino]imidazole-4-carboxamide isomerase [Candidatus Hydrogenedentes bacterium]|nr:1-(5-phosphoribosyl)-5-[(5-phosphoribosylamino)methylideneamino]imidazole-4-carboxamide isomerase [Candidatus Hydrogenedentota bacterium]
MYLLPAVDIRGGKCVNLIQGDYSQETVFSEDPVKQAKTWWNELKHGLIHIVDLDGARTGKCEIVHILKTISSAGIRYEVGGGIRSLKTIEEVINAGAERVILGTAVLIEPELIKTASTIWRNKIVVAIDAKEGKVAIEGWTKPTEISPIELAKMIADLGASRIIYTDILSDGMMKGPNYQMTIKVAQSTPLPVTMSGGISSLNDIVKAKELETYGVDEIIVGRALYLNIFTIKEALKILMEN